MKIFYVCVAISLVSLEIFLNLLLVGTAINAFILLVVITSPLWILLILFWWPMIFVAALLLKFSSVRTYMSQIITHYAKYILYTYKGSPRKKAWNFLYSLLSLGLPNNIVAQNCGFALVSASGESLQDTKLKKALTERETENLFQL